ncbi:hypothetical protein NDU88_004603, partial [Pleurodeles waltl]
PGEHHSPVTSTGGSEKWGHTSRPTFTPRGLVQRVPKRRDRSSSVYSHVSSVS